MSCIATMSTAGDDLSQSGDARSSNGHEEKVVVSVRIRPLNETENARNDVCDWECINKNTIIFKNNLSERATVPAAYTFDRVFGFESSTKQVYEDGAKEIALQVVSGINATIFAYGQTSSGKTYTMSGVTEYAIADIYNYIEMNEQREFVLKFSAIEIYNEAVRDLLSTDASPLRLLDDPEKGTVIEKLTEETLRDSSHLHELLAICEAQRKIGETSLNVASSRSHQILRLTVESSPRKYLRATDTSSLTATVNFVDLAGSERASLAMSAGTRLKEGCHINRSLLTLGSVIRKLSKGRNGHIPYRDSKLTRILQNSLGGNARTAIICTISPAHSHVEQSRNTLLFASCAKEVTTNSQVNVVMSDKALVKQLLKELARLQAEQRSLGSATITSDSAAKLREKELLIEQMDRDMKELTWQRDLAHSRVTNLLQSVDGSRLDENSVSVLSDVEPLHLDVVGLRTVNALKNLDRDGSLNSPRVDKRLSPISAEDNFLLDYSTPKFVGADPCRGWEEITYRANLDSEDNCKEVRCIAVEASKPNQNSVGDALQPNLEEKEGNLLTILPTNQMSSPVKENKEIISISEDVSYDTLKKKMQEMQKTIKHLINLHASEQSPRSVVSSSQSLKLPRSRSCKAISMADSSSPWFEKAEQNENTPLARSERDFSVKPEVVQLKPFKSRNGVNGRKRRNRTSLRSVCSEMPYAQGLDDDDNDSVVNFTIGQKEKTKSRSRLGPQELEHKGDAEGHDSTLQSNWPLEFERQRQSIIELWDECYVPLVHRTYFFLLFKGEPSDAVYMEVELRRLSFIRDAFAGGTDVMRDNHKITRASSVKERRREREMLGKLMKKKLSRKERETLFQKWGIGLKSKHRSQQLARWLWSNPKDLEHIRESATIVAKLVGHAEPSQVPRELFSLSFLPQPLKQRSFTWKPTTSTFFRVN